MALGTFTASHHKYDDTPATGTVKIFANSPVIVDEAGDVVYSGPITADIVDGQVSVPLIPTDALGYEPAEGRRYTIVTRLNHTNSVPTLTDVELVGPGPYNWADLHSGIATTPIFSPWFTEEMLADILARLAEVEQNGGGSSATWPVPGTPTTFPPAAHNHDDRYYTETETDALLAGKQPAGSYATPADVSTASTADRARTNHTGTQSLDTTTDSATRLALTTAERTKLSGVATGATANATDAQLRDRATHTGTQPVASVDGLQAALDSKVPTSRTVAGKPLSADVALTKTDVGLGNVDNTSDATKPVSTAQQAALDAKVPTTRTVAGKPLSADVTLAKADVGLGNVDNTADNAKPVSTAQAAAIAARIPNALVDAKGDLLVGTADDTVNRLGVGTNGQVLTADSATTAGVKWATPAAGGGGSTGRRFKSSNQTIGSTFTTVLVELETASTTVGPNVAQAPNGMQALVAGIYAVSATHWLTGGGNGNRNLGLSINGNATSTRQWGITTPGRIGFTDFLVLAAGDIVTTTIYVEVGSVVVAGGAVKDTGLTLTYHSALS